jgi:hypothetical protein
MRHYCALALIRRKVHLAMLDADPTQRTSTAIMPRHSAASALSRCHASGPRALVRRASILACAFGVLLSMSATAQGLIASDQPAFEAGPPIRLQVVPYPYGMYALPDVAPAVPSCYRIGRCSAYDLYYFRDRPNRLTRLAPEAPPKSVAEAAWIPYRWFLVPPTPEEHILPQYRAASQVRDEYRAVSRPIDKPN